MNNIDTMINFIAERTTRSAAIAARRGREQRGYSFQFGTLGQRAMGVAYPSRVTPAHRQTIADALTERGFTVQTNTETNLKGNTTFFSFTVTL